MNKNTIEQNILGCVILNFEFVEEFLSLLEERDFSSKPHKILYRFIEKLYKEDEATEFNISEIHTKYPKVIPSIGGYEYLADLVYVCEPKSKFKSNCESLIRESFKLDITRLSKLSEQYFKESFSDGKHYVFEQIQYWNDRLKNIN